jgi:ParB-like chromosome segregation protein Spo0J
MNITTTKLTDIKSNPNNPRIIKDDKFKKLVASIKEFPQMLSLRPIVVNDDMIVLGGNMRLKACKEAGLKEVPVIKASDLNEEQQKAFIIKDNVGYGEWDWDMLANEWDAEELVEWGLDVPVFDVDDLGSNDEKDLSDKIQSQFRIEVICIDEESQENTYNKLIEQGYECRLLTL